jgi:hypothetical protein
MIHARKLRYSNVGLPNNLLAAIGHVTALFAQLEYIVDSKISEALALPEAPKINPRLMVPFNGCETLLFMVPLPTQSNGESEGWFIGFAVLAGKIRPALLSAVALP